MSTQSDESSVPRVADDWRARAATFATLAERFIAWLDDRNTPLTPQAALRHVVGLYSAGYDLIEPPQEATESIADDPRIDDATWKSIFRRGAELPFSFYCLVLNQHEMDRDPEFGTGDLSDDLADIYRDLVGPLALYRTGDHASATWYWHWGFHNHWGEHATMAIHALHDHLTNSSPALDAPESDSSH